MPPRSPADSMGKENNSVVSLKFPLTENLTRGIRLRFTEYSRWTPKDMPTERDTAIIDLPMPLSIPDNSSLRSNNSTDLGAWGNVNLQELNKSYESVGDVFKDAWDLGTSVAKEQLQNMSENFKVSGLKALAISPLLSDDTKRNLQITAGVINNPHTTLMFEGVNLRSFTFTWRLSPRSQDESDALKRIIDIIKYRSHPAESFLGYALDYPDLCHAEFYGDSAAYLPIYYKAMVNNIQVNTGAGGGYVPFKSGAPNEQEISISLTETTIVTRDRIDGGQ